jgi:hypothetical protein
MEEKQRDWKLIPTAVYGRTSRHRRWELLFAGSAIEAQSRGDRWREDIFDFQSQTLGKTLTISISSTEAVANILPRSF